MNECNRKPNVVFILKAVNMPGDGMPHIRALKLELEI